MPAPDLLGTFEKAGGMDIKNNPGPLVLHCQCCLSWYVLVSEKLWQGRGNSNSDWGRLFANWEQLQLPADDLSVPGWEHVGDKPLKLDKETSKMIRKAFRVLGTAIREAPEFSAKKSKKHANKNVLSNGTLFHYLRQKASEDKSDGGGENEKNSLRSFMHICLTFLFSGCSREKGFWRIKTWHRTWKEKYRILLWHILKAERRGL